MAFIKKRSVENTYPINRMNERYALNNVLNNYFAVLKNGATGTNLNKFFQFQLMVSKQGDRG